MSYRYHNYFMAALQPISDPVDESRQRLETWAWRAFLRFSPLTGDQAAARLVESLLSEYLGRRIDETAHDGLQNGLSPDYPDLREFFARFAPDVALYLPRQEEALPGSIQRLRLIHAALCARIAADNPTTLGRRGRTLLAREWRKLEEDLPSLDAALERLSLAPDGDAVENECRSEIEAILRKLRAELRDARMLLELLQASRQALAERIRGPREDH